MSQLNRCDFKKMPQPPPLMNKQQQKLEHRKNALLMENLNQNFEKQIDSLKNVIIKANQNEAEARAAEKEERKAIEKQEREERNEINTNLMKILLSLTKQNDNENDKTKPTEGIPAMEDTDMEQEIVSNLEHVATNVTQSPIPKEDNNGTRVYDMNELFKENEALKIKVNNLEKSNLEAFKQIIAIENKYDEIVAMINNIQQPKSNENDKKDDVNDDKTNTNGEKEFPPLARSFSMKTNKQRGVVQHGDSEILVNKNLNDAKVVTQTKRKHVTYREALDKHIEEEALKVDKSKFETKQTNIITMDKKDDLIESIMRDMKRTIGIETKHERQVDITIRALENERKIDKKLNYREKEGAAMKAIVDTFITKEAGIDKEEWEDTPIDKLHIGIKKDNDGNKHQVIYCRLVDPKDANRLRAKMGDKPKHIQNKLTNYVHQAAFQRWKIIDNIAFQYRKNEGKSTKIWHGRSDFLLLVKDKNDTTKWSEVAPKIIPENVLVDFDVGILSPEDDEYYKALKNDKYEENLAKNELLKKRKEEEEKRIDREYDEHDKRGLPCSDHMEPDCLDCYYDDERLDPLGQRSQTDSMSSQSNLYEAVENVENLATQEHSSQSTSEDSMNSA